jgi:hypothetical protein
MLQFQVMIVQVVTLLYSDMVGYILEDLAASPEGGDSKVFQNVGILPHPCKS